ncbi:MAG: fasciclin domain-containing protein [Hyphomonadaceae bacterium]|nr:fasciclin domain-containing protein [Hyphomonadaceae bacterium]
MKHTFFAALAAVSMFAFAQPAVAESCHGESKHASAQQSADIVDVAVGAGQFQTLAAALQAAGLVDTLKGDGPFTVFAPTDDAFRALPQGTVDRLLRPENRAELTRILTYHVVPGRVTADQLAGQQTRPNTVAGARLQIDARQGVSVNNARVVQADVAASNGVIHVIDRVLLPPAH